MLRRFASLSRPAHRALSRAISTDTTVGFVGLGNMGGPMAGNLKKAGHDLVVFDLSEEATTTLVNAEGDGEVTVAGNVREVAQQASTVVTMLPSTPHVESVYLGDDGLVAGAADAGHALFCLDASTISPPAAKDVASALSGSGHTMLDAPVSGGTIGAEEATLTFMVGADADADFAKAKPLLDRMGANVVHCGGNSTGQVAKVCNNLILGISMLGVCEAMNLGKTLGADPTTLAGIINTSSGRCWSSEIYNPCPGTMEGVPSSRGFTGGFGAPLMMKDLSLALDAAQSAKVPLNLGGNAHALYQLMCTNGFDDLDFSGYWEFIQNKQDHK